VDGIVIAYLVSLAVFIPASGWLGDRFGGKRVLLSAIVVFTVGSVLCGLAQNLSELVFFRVIQGAGGGMLAPVGMAMLFRVFPPAERIRAASILTVGTTLAPPSVRCSVGSSSPTSRGAGCSSSISPSGSRR
jgi:MFS family permease